MTAKRNPELSKAEALVLSWRSRSDYKGYDRTKGSSYNSWRSITYTAKGREAGVPSEWSDYRKFMEAVQGSWAQGKVVCRINKKLPHSPENSYWAEKGTENSGKLIQFTYGDQTKTLLEWAKELGLNYQGVRQRYFRGKNLSPEEILFGKTRKIRTPKERSADFRSLSMLGAYRLRDKNKGQECNIDIKWMRDFISQKCHYCGTSEKIGLDRIDNSKGHTKANVLPACSDCNSVRGNRFTVEEMQIIGRAIKEIKQCRLAKKN